MDDFAPFFPVIASALAGVLIPLLFATKGVLRWLGGMCIADWRPFAPNWITVWSSVFVYVGGGMYAAGYWTVGIGLAGFGAILDRIDGRAAKVLGRTLEQGPYSLWFEMNFPGATDLGKVLDPGLDKARYFPVLIGFCLAGFLWWPLLVTLALPEIAGTLLRRPFHWFAGRQKESRSSAVGKIKAMLIWVVIILCVPFQEGWPAFDLTDADVRWWILNGTLGLCTILSFMSLFSRLDFFRRGAMKTAIDGLGDTFSHD